MGYTVWPKVEMGDNEQLVRRQNGLPIRLEIQRDLSVKLINSLLKGVYVLSASRIVTARPSASTCVVALQLGHSNSGRVSVWIVHLEKYPQIPGSKSTL